MTGSAIYRNLKLARAVIVLCSPSSMASRWCFVEIAQAKALGKRIFPIVISPCVIEGPADRAEIALEPGLVHSMIADARTDDALPLLAFTLREMYERCRDQQRLTLEVYRDDLGGIQGAVARVVERIKTEGAWTPDVGRALRRAFLKLVRVNDEGQFTRQRCRWADLPDLAKAQTLVAENATKQAKAQTRIATSRQLAALSVAERDKRFDRSLLLAVEALRAENTFEAREILYQDLQQRPGLSSFLHINEGGDVSLAFSPDGKTIVAGFGGDSTNYCGFVLCDVDLESWQRHASRIANRNFTLKEWRDYFPDTPYRATFPDLPVPLEETPK